MDNDKITTSCKDCIFALTENNKQTGCTQNRLEKFEKTWTDDSYYLLDGICNMCRNQEWKEKVGDAYLEHLQAEISLKIDIIFINNNFSLHKIEQNIIENMRILDKNKIKPQSVIFSTTIPALDIKKYLKLVQKHCPYKYHVVNPIASRDFWPVHNLCVKRSKANYYLTVKLDTDFDLTVIDQIDQRLNETMQKFLMIEGENGVLIQRYLHSLLGGSTDVTIVDKIRELNTQQKENMVISWEQLQP